MAAGVFGYLGYDMVRLMEELGAPQPDPIGIPDAILVRPTVVIVFDAVKRHDHGRDPGAAGPGRRGRRGLCARGRTARPRSSTRSTVRSPTSPPAPPTSRSRCSRSPTPPPAEYRRDGAQGQGIHRRRRHLPGGAVAALRGAVRAAAVRALPRAAARQPGAVPLLSRFRRLRRGRLEPGNPGAGARRQGHHPADRRHAAARRRPRTRTRRSRTSCSPIRRSAPST